MSLAHNISNMPLGTSRKGHWDSSGFWNTENHGTDGPINCDICGTHHPENQDQSYLTFRFFGRQGVEQCCGRLLDEAYRQFGARFAETYLKEYARNPGSDEYTSFRLVLSNSLETALKNTSDANLVSLRQISLMPRP